MVKQCSLSGAQETGDYGGGDAIIRLNLGQNVGALALRRRCAARSRSEPSVASVGLGDKSSAKRRRRVVYGLGACESPRSPREGKAGYGTDPGESDGAARS